MTLRLDDELLGAVDRERKRFGLARSRVVREALALWLERRRLDEAVRRHRAGYAAKPVTADEFEPVLGAQRWPK
ncbi:MAG: ribbon-helix-helix protein, CopG family [Myxococcota bacterium]